MYKNHILAYNDFLSSIPHIIRTIPSLKINNIQITVTDVLFDRPVLADDTITKLLPNDCVEGMRSYRGRMHVKVHVNDGIRGWDELKSAGYFPVMVGSRLCHNEINEEQLTSYYDDVGDGLGEARGGYFVIDGFEKVVRFLIVPKRNFPFLIQRESFRAKNAMFTAKAVEYRSVYCEVGHVLYFHLMTDENVMMRFTLKRREYSVPVILVLKALKDVTDRQILDLLGVEGRFILDTGVTTANARKMLGAKFASLGINVLDAILPHLRTYSDKFDLLILILRRLRDEEYDDMDALSSQELFGVRQLFSGLLRDKLEEGLEVLRYVLTESEGTNEGRSKKKESGKMRYELAKANNTPNDSGSGSKAVLTANDVLKKLRFNVAKRAEHFLATGNLILRTNDLLQTTGLAVLAERINTYRFISHFESVNRGAFFAMLKTTSVRALRPESFGFLCPVHTPDGAPCGLIVHMAMDAIVGREEELRVKGCLVGSRRLVVGGRVVGYVDDRFSEYLRRRRRAEGLKVEIVDRKGAVYVFGGAGRLMRKVLDGGVEVYVGVMEQVDAVVLNECEKGEMEIRDCENRDGEYGAKTTRSKGNTVNAHDYRYKNNENMHKREYINEKNLSYRNGANTHELGRKDEEQSHKKGEYVHKQDVKDSGHNEALNSTANRVALDQHNAAAHTSQYLKMPVYRERPNARFFSYVASTIPFSDYNQSPRNMYQCQMAKQAMAYPTFAYERRTDSKFYVLNNMQRPLIGTFLSALLGTNVYIAVLSYTSYDMEDAMVINKSAIERGLFDGYVYITKVVERTDGVVLPDVGELLMDGSVLYVKDGESVKYTGECARVHRVRVTDTLAIITLRVRRSPQIGDKFCSRHGQKGVLSYRYRAVDLPFNEHGMVPDLIINPHAFPSRMTVGMMMEMLAGTVAVVKGERYACPPFKEYGRAHTHEYFCEQLQALGLNYYGNETLYSGVTGQPLQARVFTGMCYYQRLRHMVSDKWQVRSVGPVQAQTRQPIKGRKKGGGVRFGEMERDALIAHGCAYLLSDRLMECSDKTAFEYCEQCKTFLFARNGECLCGCKRVKVVYLPYVFKYLCTELLGMNIFVEVDVGL